MKVIKSFVCIVFAMMLPVQSFAKDRVSPETWLPGSVIRHPEKLSGLWEMKNGKSILGIQIRLTTMVKGSSVALQGVDQYFHHAMAEIFEQKGIKRVVRDGYRFEADSAGVEWNGNHLKIHRVADAQHNFPETQIDLVFDPMSDSWTGHFHRGKIDQDVTLRRPFAPSGVTISPLVGTWKRATEANNCLHIAQEERGSFVAWSDDLIVPADAKPASGLKQSKTQTVQYGSFAQITAEKEQGFLVKFNALTSKCCSTDGNGLTSPNGEYLQTDGKDRSTMRSAQNANDWKRVQGDSCIADAN